ncbi:MAG: hypothetical protein IK062_07630 [Selenomonadaceae bacterium]|nr:hypothetical protein [Selenomonadaceae bacterium]
MKKKILILTLMLISVSAVGYADNNSAINSITGSLNEGFGENFTTQLANLSRSILNAAQIIAVIMTAIAGCMVCFGINEGKKTF